MTCPSICCFPLSLWGAFGSALGFSRTTYVLRLCSGTVMHLSGGATSYCVIFTTQAWARSKGWVRATVYRGSPALDAAPTWSADGLHATLSSPQCLKWRGGGVTSTKTVREERQNPGEWQLRRETSYNAACPRHGG